MINKKYYKKERIVLISIVVVFSIVAAGAAFTGSAAAVEGVSDEQVTPDGEVTITVAPENTDNTLGIQGDTGGWTVESTTPSGVTVNPEAGTVLGTDDSISTFSSYDSNGEFSVTLSPPSNVSEGEVYNFTATESSDGASINSESFTISIVSSSSDEDDDSDSDETTGGDASDKQVAPNGEVTTTLTPKDTSNTLAIQGDTGGWTVVSTTPSGLTVSPPAGTVLDPEGGENDTISTFGSYDADGNFSVTLSPPREATVGETYQFDVQEVNNGATVNTDSFTISIGSSAPSWVADRGLTAAQYNAFDDGDGELTDTEVRNGIQTYVQNSITGDGEIDGVRFSDSDIRSLITGYVQSQID